MFRNFYVQKISLLFSEISFIPLVYSVSLPLFHSFTLSLFHSFTLSLFHSFFPFHSRPLLSHPQRKSLQEQVNQYLPSLDYLRRAALFVPAEGREGDLGGEEGGLLGGERRRGGWRWGLVSANLSGTEEVGGSQLGPYVYMDVAAFD